MDSIIKPTWIQEIKNRANRVIASQPKTEPVKYKCNKCKDQGWIFNKEGEVYFCECREITQAKERLERSGIAHRIKENTFKSYKQDNKQREEAVSTCLKYISDFKTNKPSLILMGEVGAGKTHLAIATANKLLSKYAVKYISYVKDIKELKFRMFDTEYYNKMIYSFRNTEVLFIDDLFKGLEKNIDPARAKAELDIMYDIVDYRYNNKKPVLITTELDINRMMQIDKALASRILEMSKGYRISFEGVDLNYRIFGD